MSERYTKLFSLPENLYEKDCPVMICAGALSKDNQADKVFVQLRFQNIDGRYRTIVAVKVAIQAFDVANHTLGGVKEYQYLDIKTERGAEAGGKQPVYLDDNTARSFSVSVLEAVFEDGGVWTGNTQDWCSLQQIKLEDKFSNDLMEQYQRDAFAEAKYEPFTKDGVWMCACGALNTIEDSKCCRCHNDKVKQFTALDHNLLASNLQTHNEKEQVAIKTLAEKSNKKRQKGILIGCAVVFLILLCISVPQLVLDNQHQPYTEKLIGTTWWWNGSSWNFSGENTLSLIDEVWEDGVGYRKIYIDGNWEILGVENRQYSVDGTYFSGDAMRIGVNGDWNHYWEIDVWIINDEVVLVLEPEQSWRSICHKQQ